MTKHDSWWEKLLQSWQNKPQDRDELVSLIRDAEQQHVLDAEALKMMEGVMQVSELRARDIMIPRSQIVMVDGKADLDEVLSVVIDSAHSRFPVVGDSRDEVEGILLAKDLLHLCLKQKKRPVVNFRSILRPAVFIPESKRLDVLLREFRINRNHMAMVTDEYSGVAGVVTIEDVLEQIVGDITDEHDLEDDHYILKHSDGSHNIKALIPIEEFNEYFSATFPTKDFDTIGGLVMHQFGHVPKRGEAVTMNDFNFSVIRSDKRRIRLMKLIRQDTYAKVDGA
jgi:magnesium and cobalt transporter